MCIRISTRIYQIHLTWYQCYMSNSKAGYSRQYHYFLKIGDFYISDYNSFNRPIFRFTYSLVSIILRQHKWKKQKGDHFDSVKRKLQFFLFKSTFTNEVTVNTIHKLSATQHKSYNMMSHWITVSDLTHRNVHMKQVNLFSRILSP